MSDILPILRREIAAATTVGDLEALEAEICDRLALARARGTYATGLRAALAAARRRLDALEGAWL